MVSDKSTVLKTFPKIHSQMIAKYLKTIGCIVVLVRLHIREIPQPLDELLIGAV